MCFCVSVDSDGCQGLQPRTYIPRWSSQPRRSSRLRQHSRSCCLRSTKAQGSVLIPSHLVLLSKEWCRTVLSTTMLKCAIPYVLLLQCNQVKKWWLSGKYVFSSFLEHCKVVRFRSGASFTKHSCHTEFVEDYITRNNHRKHKEHYKQL